MRTRIKNLLTGLFAVALSACASGNTALKIHHINALSSVHDNDGAFRGLEFLADPAPNGVQNRVNIFYLHGIGWTEKPDEPQLGNDFLEGIAQAYDLDVDGELIQSSCGEKNGETDSAHASNHIYITTGDQPAFYQTVLPGARLKLDRLVCMDKQILPISEELEFVVYRIFWDDIFWNTLQFPHIGHDDDQGASKVFARLRQKYNRRLKDELVNYGISDAVMYLGPAGNDIRRAIRGAMCAAALDAAGHSFAQQGHDVARDKACQLATNTSIKANQFAFVTESLGSKIAFDIMRNALTDGRDTILDEMIAGSETYMLANQLALLSLSQLSTREAPPAQISPSKPRPKIVALSEINDVLTYEINPFFEQLWKRQHVDGEVPPYDENIRQELIEKLGFDFVDLRLEFADKPLGVFDFVDPMQAHLGHVAEPDIIRHLLCGAQNGKLRNEGCLATAPRK